MKGYLPEKVVEADCWPTGREEEVRQVDDHSEATRKDRVAQSLDENSVLDHVDQKIGQNLADLLTLSEEHQEDWLSVGGTDPRPGLRWHHRLKAIIPQVFCSASHQTITRTQRRFIE